MYLVCYDIRSNSLRLKIANKLLELGLTRIQKSVFCGELKKPLLKELTDLLAKTVTAGTGKLDRAFIMPVGFEQMKRVRHFGEKPDGWDMLTDPPKIIFF